MMIVTIPPKSYCHILYLNKISVLSVGAAFGRPLLTVSFWYYADEEGGFIFMGSFYLTFSFYCPRRTGLTFVLCDKSKQKRTFSQEGRKCDKLSSDFPLSFIHYYFCSSLSQCEKSLLIDNLLRFCSLLKRQCSPTSQH